MLNLILETNMQDSTQHTDGKKNRTKGLRWGNSSECSGMKKKCETEGLRIRITHWFYEDFNVRSWMVAFWKGFLPNMLTYHSIHVLTRVPTQILQVHKHVNSCNNWNYTHLRTTEPCAPKHILWNICCLSLHVVCGGVSGCFHIWNSVLMSLFFYCMCLVLLIRQRLLSNIK